jgi:hypothetical protein
MRHAGDAIGGLLAVVAIVLVNAVILTSSLGVVREHCLDVDESERSGKVDVDNHWTYIIWPPFTFAGLDPAGRCVRNLPFREGLHQLGIWELPSPERQVRDHLQGQLREGDLGG